MRVVTPQVHKALDLVTVVAFTLAPTLIPLSRLAAVVAYGLAVVHLAVTLTTEFTGAGRKPFPLWGHGALEAIVGTLLVLPFVAGWIGRPGSSISPTVRSC